MEPIHKENQIALVDPNVLPIEKVHIYHFKDARLYDNQCQPGFEIQYWYAKKKYRKWLKKIRTIEGWEQFRKPPEEVFDYVRINEDEILIIRKIIRHDILEGSNKDESYEKIRKAKRDKPTNQDDSCQSIPQNKTKQMLFTEKMGTMIKQLRQEQGYSQEDLARELGITEKAMNNIERGGLLTFDPESELVKKLAKILEVPAIIYQE
jgi:DNA-binding XRE family transcriptional regulator